MGDSRRFMTDNPIHRYSVGGRPGLLPNADGSIDIYIQNTDPAGRESNWLPSPNVHFMLWLRVYQPGATILRGENHVPSIVEVKGVASEAQASFHLLHSCGCRMGSGDLCSRLPLSTYVLQRGKEGDSQEWPRDQGRRDPSQYTLRDAGSRFAFPFEIPLGPDG